MTLTTNEGHFYVGGSILSTPIIFVAGKLSDIFVQ